MTKILLVEDHDVIRAMLAERLRLRGYDVSELDSGIDIVAQAEREAPDVVIMDLSLPEIDGWEATRQLKSAIPTAHLPILALTAHAMADDRDRALAAGCDDYDTKPIDFNRLLAKIMALLTPTDGNT